jgi:CHASE2 domain-containing sensor protein
MITASLLLASQFVLVMIDKKTEDALGPFPYDRSVLAQAVERSAALGARGVVLKFFMPGLKSEKGDRALADAMRKTKVLLEAGYPGVPASNTLPERFKLNLPVNGKLKALPASIGAMPLPAFSAAAHDVGWVDNFDVNRAPMIEAYEGKYVKALLAACLELYTAS